MGNSAKDFKVGDLVIINLTTQPPMLAEIVEASDGTDGDFSIAAKDSNRTIWYFMPNGVMLRGEKIPRLFHATPEKILAFNELYGCDLKLPMTPNEIIKAMLDRGDKFVVARVSDKSFDDARVNLIEPIIVERVNSAAQLPIRTFQDVGWFFGIPIDPRTGLEITEADLEAQS